MRRILAVLAIVLVVQVLIPSVSHAAPPPAGCGYYQVRAGDTLFAIGRLYNVSPYAIASANSLSNPDLIYVGQSLRIPSGPPYPSYPSGWPGPCPAPGPCWECTYVVQYGDTLYAIARRYGVPTLSLAQYNSIANPNYIWVGQRLIVPCYWDPT